MRLYKIQATSIKVDVTNRSDDISLNAKVDETAKWYFTFLKRPIGYMKKCIKLF
jgi:hypothetical protein